MRKLSTLGVVSSIAIASAASAQNAVQWRVEDGGNGHWYARGGEFLSFPAAATACNAIGGHLATPVTAAENAFLAAQYYPYSENGTTYAYWIGGFRQTQSSPWQWITNELWNFESFAVFEPSGCCGPDVRFLAFRSFPGHEGRWDDTSTNGHLDQNPQPFLIEWSADCNSDGIVDYGQIISGELADTNANNIPDCCETATNCDPCPADVDGSGAVNGVDLAAILNVWGTSGGKYPGADVNRDGIVDGSDLAEVLNGWGVCP